MDVELMDVPAFRVGVARADMSRPADAWSEFFAAEGAGALGGQPGVSALAIFPVTALMADDAEGAEQGEPPAPPRYDAGVIVPEDIDMPGSLTELRVPAGRYACATYIGPVEGLSDAWGEFSTDWLAESGESLRHADCFEVYRSGPDTPPAEMRTNLFIPIAYK